MDAVAKFIEFLNSCDIPPSDPGEIVADDTWRRFHVVGDRKGASSGGYILACEDGFAWGGAVGFATGGGWNVFKSGDVATLSPEQRADIARRAEKKKREQEEIARQRELDGTAEAKELFDKAKLSDGLHPYLGRKKIKPHGVRELDGLLVVPMWREGRFVSIQTIDSAGEKRFQYGVSTKGAYHALASKDDPKDKFLLCEGFATAATLREWFPSTPVVMAFVKDNLLSVAQYFRIKYPDADIIVCADNDAWQRRKPTDAERVYVGVESNKNGGIVKGRLAALDVGGRCVWPDWGDHAGRPTDFNDAVSVVGDDQIWRAEVQRALDAKPIAIHTPKPPAVEIAGWKEMLLIKDAGVDKCGNEYTYLRENSINYSLIVCHHPRLKGVFSFDEFALSVKVVKPPPWVIDRGEESSFEVTTLTDYEERQTDYFIQQLGHRLTGSIEKTRGAIADAAKENRMHPPREYLDSLRWDGVPRLDTWLIDYMAATHDDPDYVCAVGRAWLIAAVKRLYEPGCKFDNMLVLEGAQGAGKSECLKILATFGDEGQQRTYFTESFNMRKCSDKDELMKLAGVVIVEIAEMAGFGRADQDSIKNFITTTHDKFRAPYGRAVEEWPRQFVLAGTFNPGANGLFTDPTGLRRFWPVKVGRRSEIRLEALKADARCLWAEAVHRYKAGESIMLSDAIYKKAAEAANDRRAEDYATEQVLDAAERLGGAVTVQQIMRMLGYEVIPGHNSQKEARAIGDILRVAGWEAERRRTAQGRRVYWTKPLPIIEPVTEEEIDF